MEQLKKAKAYIDALTVDSPVNIPEKIVPDPEGFLPGTMKNGPKTTASRICINGAIITALCLKA